MFQLHPSTSWSNMLHLRRMLGLLMLMFLLCDANRICTPDLITLSPQVVAKYGETIVLNCTTPSDDYQDLFLKIETEEIHVDSEVLITKWDMKVECVIQLDHFFECKQEVEIVVYKTPDSVSVSAGVMEEGAENLLSCDVTNVAPLKALRVMWYRDNEMVQTQTFDGTSVTPVNVSSTLTITAMKEDSLTHFRCQAELHLGPNGPKLVPTVTSSVYTPAVLYKPTIQGCSGHYTGVEHDFRIDRLTCRVDGNPPPTVQWYYGGAEINASVPLTRTGSGRYTAEAVNSLGKDSTSVYVTVNYAPVFMTNQSDIVVYKGQNVSLSCDADGFPQAQFIWTCDGTRVRETTNYLLIGQIKRTIQCKCTASNLLSSATKEFNIFVYGLSPAVLPAATTTPEAAPLSECTVILSPAEVAVRFGDPLSINCSTSAADVKQVDFIVPFGGTQADQPFFVTWAAEEVKEWVVKAQCLVTLESYQCFEMPRITVYKTPDSVSVSAGVMEEGAENLLSCDVTNVAPLMALRVAWYRENEMVQTQTFDGTSVTPVNVSSTLTITAMKEDSLTHFRCQAELHLGPNGPKLVPTVTSSVYTPAVLYKPTIQGCSGTYTGVEHDFRIDRLTCRVDGNPPPTVQWYYGGAEINASVPLTRTGSGRYTAEAVNSLGKDSTSVYVTVEYAPVFMTNQSDIVVYKGQNVSLSCDADGFPQPQFIWTCDGTRVRETTNYLLIGQIKRTIQCKCTASNLLSSATKEFNIFVYGLSPAVLPAATTTPEAAPLSECTVILSPAEVAVRFGDPLSINCSTSAADVKQVDFIVPFGGTQADQPFFVTWAAEEVKEWVVKAQCLVTLESYQCFEMPRITVYKTPDSVSVSAGVMEEGAENLLSCDVTNVAPLKALRVMWYRDNEMVQTQTFDGTSVTPVNVSSTLTITAMKEDSLTHFRCQAELHLGPNGPSLIPAVTSSVDTPAVLYKPTIQGCSGTYTGVEHDFRIDRLTCRVEGNPPPTVQWYYGGAEINASVPLTRTGSGRYTAEAVNSLGKDSTSVYVTVEYAPSFTCNQHYEIREDAQVQSVCEPEGVPSPVTTWTKDGVLLTTPRRWTKQDSGNYSLRATNSHGTDSHVLYLDVLYAPVFNLENYTQEVYPGENVSLECSAEGNPPPEIYWEYAPAVNAMATTGGRQKNITITGATSTNAGVYICVAKSKAGRVTRSVTLLMKGETSQIPAEIVWMLLLTLILLIVIILIIFILCCKRKKTNGEYRFVGAGLGQE